MFESQKFLASYLPVHFGQLFSPLLPPNPALKDGLSLIAFLSRFLTFSHNLYMSIRSHNIFPSFLKQNFLPPSAHSQQHSEQKSSPSPYERLMEVISSRSSQVIGLAVKLYLQLVDLDVQLKERSVDQEQRNQWINLLVKVCQEMRVAFEVQKISNSYLEVSYDDYMQNIFISFLNLECSKEFELLIEDLVKEDCINLSDEVKESIIRAISSKQKHPFAVEMVHFDSSAATKKKLPEHRRSFERSEISSNYDRQDGSVFNRSFSTSIQNKSLEDEDSRKSFQRISEFAKAKKHKMITKERTIYHQRKNTYIAKKSSFQDNFEEQIRRMKTSTSLKGQATKRREERMENEDELQESILVRSTPKKVKVTQFSVISQKLEFSDL